MAQQQQVWANPGPWALLAVAVLTACVGFVYTGLLPGTTVPLLVGILLACSLPQLIGAIICFRGGDFIRLHSWSLWDSDNSGGCYYPFAGIAEVGVAFLFLGINALTGSMAAGVIAGWLLIIFSAFCIYASAAILWAEHFQRPILPLGRPVFK